ncbi:hypothetical protein PRIPAC_93864 [Pristionchus pacificus]|uniref:Uncharacterized protein n=1 Tax=Pristionchus pacificus TaxID=54126 RepID=A0A2A6BQ47_PRIPA|nr:hypothetical protein PRIPAC_93864 [Pristionchus pacificus]|eukprot:PDM68017.1 hypothetical protein PRIPAC_46061 [Pristionchus pacificus]
MGQSLIFPTCSICAASVGQANFGCATSSRSLKAASWTIDEGRRADEMKRERRSLFGPIAMPCCMRVCANRGFAAAAAAAANGIFRLLQALKTNLELGKLGILSNVLLQMTGEGGDQRSNLLRLSLLSYTKYFHTGVCLFVPPDRMDAAGLRCHDQSAIRRSGTWIRVHTYLLGMFARATAPGTTGAGGAIGVDEGGVERRDEASGRRRGANCYCSPNQLSFITLSTNGEHGPY